MTQVSSSESGVTTEIGLVGEPAVPDCCHSDASSSPARCDIPKVQPALNRSDQRVPVYRDQTVPVWSPCKRKSAHASNRSSYGVYNNHTVYFRSSPRNRSNKAVHKGDCRRRSGNATGISSEVSFDDCVYLPERLDVKLFFAMVQDYRLAAGKRH